MTDYVITGGRSSNYPEGHYGAHFTGSRATFCETADFAGLDSNTLAIPFLPITSLSNSPVTVGDEFFGMVVQQRANDALTGVTAKTIRLHDMANGKARWQFIQPTASSWNWTDLDSAVNTHYAAGRDLIFQLFGTPAWASARPTELGAYGSGGNLGIQAEPADMTKWDAFCTAVASRYAGKIKYYEIWNEVNYQNNGTTTTGVSFYFSGTFAKIAEMTRRAAVAIKTADPAAKILCPSTTVWLATASATDTYFTTMLGTSTGDGSTVMKDWIDIIDVHLYLPTQNKVADLAGMIDRINACKVTAGVSGLPTWDTESGPIGPDTSTLSDTKSKRIIARHMLTSAAKGIARTCYYAYDSSLMGIIGRTAILSYRESMITLLKSGTILAMARFADGRVGYWTASGLTII